MQYLRDEKISLIVPVNYQCIKQLLFDSCSLKKALTALHCCKVLGIGMASNIKPRALRKVNNSCFNKHTSYIQKLLFSYQLHVGILFSYHLQYNKLWIFNLFDKVYDTCSTQSFIYWRYSPLQISHLLECSTKRFLFESAANRR